MPKSKKRKTHHQTSTASHGELSHAEIWDDSALIRSWNDAVAEYEYYHSIHAKGEDVEEVLRQAEAEEERERKLQDDVEAGNLRATTLDVKADARDDDNEPEDGEIEDDGGPSPTVLANGGANDKLRDGKSLGFSNSSSQQPESTQAAANLASSQSSSKATTKPQLQPQPVSPPISSTITPQEAMTGAGNFQTDPTQSVGERPAEPGAEQTLENVKMAYYWAGYYSGLYDGQKQSGGGASSLPSS